MAPMDAEFPSTTHPPLWTRRGPVRERGRTLRPVLSISGNHMNLGGPEPWSGTCRCACMVRCVFFNAPVLQSGWTVVDGAVSIETASSLHAHYLLSLQIFEYPVELAAIL